MSLKEFHFSGDDKWTMADREHFALPVLSISREGMYTLSWHWKDGKVEKIKSWRPLPGVYVTLPCGCVVMSERTQEKDRKEQQLDISKKVEKAISDAADYLSCVPDDRGQSFLSDERQEEVIDILNRAGF